MDCSHLSEGQCLIIIHAGGENTFIPKAPVVWKFHQAAGDYHHSMNQDNYEKWVKEKLVPNLSAESVVVINNVPYHNVKINKIPVFNSTKNEMHQWLQKQNIPLADDMLKPTLHRLFKQYKHQQVQYSVDKTLESHGHTILHLPPYHSDLNPVKNIWANVKGQVASRNVTCNIEDVERLCEEIFHTMGKEDWKQATL
jgi:transposase